VILYDRFPALERIPRAELCTLPSPVVRIDGLTDSAGFWVKRDDANAPTCGGNKVRSLEFLLGGLESGDTVVTVGGAGSTHVLSTAIHAARLGVRTVAVRWPHDMNPVADIVSRRIAELNPGNEIRRSTVLAILQARYYSATHSARFIPLGGATPLGILGHVNAALELAEQIRSNELPMPESVVLPLGSGGTVAGLVLGFAIAGLPITVVGARAGPRLFVNRIHVMNLVRRTSAFISRVTGERLPRVDSSRLRVVHDVYAGAYGRVLDRASGPADIFHAATGLTVDDTYSAKALVAAIDEARSAKGPVLFWLTFDARCLTN
jgi:D-cysteine desulfhydrase